MKPDTSHIATILIIDNDEDDRSFYKEAICEVSPLITVVFRKCTDRILEVIESTKPSLIFIEHKLPKENGIECVQRLKSLAAVRAIPVIMWSTGSLVPVVEAAYKAGVQLYVEKPWDLKVWIDQIKMVVQQNFLELPGHSEWFHRKVHCLA